MVFRPRVRYFRSQSVGPDFRVLFSARVDGRNAVSQLPDLFQTHICWRGPRQNVESTFRQPWGFYEVLCTPMDARRKVSIDAFIFSPRSQTSDQILKKNIPKLGPKGDLWLQQENILLLQPHITLRTEFQNVFLKNLIWGLRSRAENEGIDTNFSTRIHWCA